VFGLWKIIIIIVIVIMIMMDFCVNALSGFLLDLNLDITFQRRGFGFPLQITITWIFLYSTALFSHQSSMLVGFTVVKCRWMNEPDYRPISLFRN
jgi:hypothetical protein